jgi:hypothetical protein
MKWRVLPIRPLVVDYTGDPVDPISLAVFIHAPGLVAAEKQVGLGCRFGRPDWPVTQNRDGARSALTRGAG